MNEQINVKKLQHETVNQLKKEFATGEQEYANFSRSVRTQVEGEYMLKDLSIEDIQLTEEEEKRYVETDPPELPEGFKELTKKQRSDLEKKQRGEYDKQKSKVDKDKKQWLKDTDTKRDAYKKILALRKLEERAPRIEANPDTMMEELARNSSRADEIEKVAQAKVMARRKYNELDGDQGMREAGIKAYLGDYYESMNAYLRGDEKVEENKKTITKIAADAINEEELSKDMVLRRGVDIESLKFMFVSQQESAWDLAKEVENKLKMGDELMFEEKGFCSTTCYKDGGFDKDLDIVMVAHKGTKGMVVAGTDVPQYEKEKEVLLAPKTKFKVVGMKRIEEDYRIYYRMFVETIVEDKKKTA